MRLSHLHLAFVDYPAAVQYFEAVLGLTAAVHSSEMTLFHCAGFDLVLHPDWGQGDTSMTLAISSQDCTYDFSKAVERGARPRTAPKRKATSVNADVFGPGNLVIEFEQSLI